MFYWLECPYWGHKAIWLNRQHQKRRKWIAFEFSVQVSPRVFQYWNSILSIIMLSMCLRRILFLIDVAVKRGRYPTKGEKEREREEERKEKEKDLPFLK